MMMMIMMIDLMMINDDNKMMMMHHNSCNSIIKPQIWKEECNQQDTWLQWMVAKNPPDKVNF